MAIVTDHPDLFERQAQDLGRNLSEDQMRSLPHIGSPDQYFRPLKLCISKDSHGRRRLFGKAKRIANIFDPTGYAYPPTHICSLILLPGSFISPACTYLLHTAFKDCQGAYASWQRVLSRFNTAFAVQITPPHLNRVNPQGMSQTRDHDFTGELRLGRAEPTKSAAGNVIGIDSIPVGRNIGPLITTTGKKCGGL